MAEDFEARADLHLHSKFSDGEDEPAELVRKASRKGLSVISIADHDTIEGVSEAVRAGEEFQVEVIPAVELSTMFHNLDIHILGYLIDMENQRFNQALDRFARARRVRAEKMVKNLRAQGLSIDFADVEMLAGKGTIGRPHVALALIKRGVVRSFDEAFYNYIGTHCPAYVRKYELKPKEAIDLIHDAGGLAILAHPLVGRQGEAEIMELLDSGLDGMEFRHPRQSPEDSEKIRRIAEARGILITGGSDYHGEKRGPCTLGESTVPVRYVQALREALRDRGRGALRIVN
jgi:predicted metal-dependent phosphoesterase TrpH